MTPSPFVRPPALRAGDRIGIVAPASPFEREAFERGVTELARLGFEAVYDERVFARSRYVAGSPTLRAAALHAMWSDPTVAGLVCARGGFGSAQVLPLLEPRLLMSTPKVFIGYSDITSMLTTFAQWGLVVFHGPTLVGRLSQGEAGYDARSLLDAVTATRAMGEVSSPALESLVPGEASGVLIGGTMTQLAASLGTPFAFTPPSGHVLFLEDVNERPYRLDRLLTQLRQAGILARASALVFGELPRCDEPGGAITARDVVVELTEGFPGPVLMGFSSGHTSHPARTLPFGVRARVRAGRVPQVIIEEPAVQ